MYEYRILLHPLQPPNFYAEIKFIVGTVFVAVARLFARPEMNRFQRTTFRGTFCLGGGGGGKNMLKYTCKSRHIVAARNLKSSCDQLEITRGGRETG